MRWTSLIGAAAIAGVLVYWFVLRHVPEDVVAPEAPDIAAVEATGLRPPPVAVVVMDSIAQDSPATLTLRGRTEANRNVQVAAETTGRVISEPLRRGAAVSAGQVLCRLEPGVRAAELDEAEASLAEAEVEATAATQLRQKGFTAETTLKASQARLQAAQARLDRVRWDIGQLEVRAPFDGVLETDTAELGALLSQGAYCANVIDLSNVKVTAFVSEQEVDALSVGQAAHAKLINGVNADGKITFISRMADENTRTFAVEITLENRDGRLRDGMTAELQVELPAQEAHLLPQQALTLNDDGRLGVRTEEDGIARFRPVTILRDTNEGVWVAGLASEARIIIIGQDFVRDGRRVLGTVTGTGL
jgi:multidrug efflux system membrane fusion protein